MSPTPRIQRLSDQLLAEPSMFAQKLEPFSRRVLLLRMSPELYSQASFLDDRILTPGLQGVWVSLDDISAAVAGAAPARPLHFIFHAGHVGSTLVSRLLESAGGVLSLREPLPLRSLAEVHDALGGADSLFSGEQFEALLHQQVLLWSRGYADTRVVVLKATSTAGRLGTQLLNAAPHSRAIYLTLPLEPYLATLLAGENSPIDLRGHAAERMRRLIRLGAEPPTSLHAMSLGELAALSWSVENLTAAALQRDCGPRVLLINFDRVLDQPEQSLRAICAHFGLEAPADYFERIRQNPAWLRYAKDPAQPYSPQDRQQLLAAARKHRADELRAGLAWTETMAARFPPLAALVSKR